MNEEKPIDQVRRMLAGLISPDMPFMERRAQAEKFAQAFVAPEGVAIAPGELGGVGVEWIVPAGATERPVLLHLHGGGYVLGNPAGSRPFTTAFALKSEARVASVDYRLAPEHPFPAAVEDAVKAYRALLAEGYRGADIAIGGESAGGGLALATLLALRHERVELPACAFAVSPWADMTCTAASFDGCAGRDPMLTRRALKEMADAYLAGTSAWHPFASPLYGDLAGLPPLLVHVGSDEVLLDDARAIHAAARLSGVHCTLGIYRGMIHVWHMFHPVLPEADRAIAEIAAFAAAHWRRQWAG
jgi:acetyl esterase/lipase